MSVQVEKRHFNVKKRYFNVGEYYQMARAGILSEDDRVELIEGEVVKMSPIGSRHAACVKRLIALLSREVGEVCIIGAQDPIRLSEYSEPQPDITLLKPREDFYSSEHPAAEDVLLLIEVSETSAEYDLEVKLPLYAAAGIPEVWLIDLEKELLEVHSRPAGEQYRTTERAKRGDSIRLHTVPRLEITAGAVLG